MSKITYIDEVEIKNQIILLRVDFNVSLNADHTIANDERIKQSLPTINYLLKNNNRLIIISHLGRPKGYDPVFSLQVVAEQLKKYLPDVAIGLAKSIEEVKEKKETVVFLENIRFFPEEKTYSETFAQKLASLGNIYVNDAFGVCHRAETSVIGPPKFIPAYGGLLLKKEVETITKAIKNPVKPVVAIIGGAKISTKITLLHKLIEITDYLLIGGTLANTFFCTQGLEIGQSFCEYEAVALARKLLFYADQKNTTIILPSDVVINKAGENNNGGWVKKIDEIPKGAIILDIGPETQAQFGSIIAQARTIIWNGPVGYFENPAFRRGTDFIYYAITQNQKAISIIGGGDTLSAIAKKEYLDKITHISTGGGAMLEFIEKGTLPGIEALKK